MSNTERELLGVLHGLLQGCTVIWHTDAKNVAKIVRRGSMKAYLLNLAVSIFNVS